MCFKFCWISNTALSLLIFNLIFWAMSGEFEGRWQWPFWSTCTTMMNQPINISQDGSLETLQKTWTVLLIVSLTCEVRICDGQLQHSQVRRSTCSSLAQQYFSPYMGICPCLCLENYLHIYILDETFFPKASHNIPYSSEAVPLSLR
jgi:hypothetical protein